MPFAKREAVTNPDIDNSDRETSRLSMPDSCEPNRK
jgi:hypothetical protein